MTGISTGGFVVTDDGIASHGSMFIEAAVVPFMLIGAISFAVHYHLLQGKVETLVTDAQSQWLFVLVGAGVGVVTLLLAAIEPPLEAIRFGGFQVASALTSTGFQTETNVGNTWPMAGHLVLTSAMVIGGAAGSTAGGVKLIRAISLTRGTLYSVTDFFHEDDDRTFAIAREDADVTVGQSASEFDHATIVGFLWIVSLVTVLFVSLVALPTGEGGYTFVDILFEAASAQGNVGLSVGITNPDMQTSVKAVFVASMWVGRLEIIPVMVTVRVLLWGFE